MQTICPLCNTPASKSKFEERSYKVMLCECCGLLFISPYPENSGVQHEKVIGYTYSDLDVVNVDRHYKASIQLYHRYFDNIAEQCQGASSLLDVGCGTGHLLERAGRELSMYCEGIELNNERAQYASHITGCTVHQMPIEQFQSDRHWDVITLIDVLSHIPSLDDLFVSLRRLLSKDGKVILIVGEIASTVRKEAIFDWGIPDHMHFLGLNTIDIICNKYELRVLYRDRKEYSEDLFSVERWKASGRSRARDLVKNMVVHTPGVLSSLQLLYKIRFGEGSIYRSFIVLGKK